MPRWEGDALGRLERAALDLFEEQGYEGTTIAQIVRRAGLTERSFYRYFPDKREALFGGAEQAQATLVAAIEQVPSDVAPLPALLAAFVAVRSTFPAPEYLRRRNEIVLANAQLRERELIKYASMSDSIRGALERRGLQRDAAQLVTDLGMTALRRAIERMLGGNDGDAEISELLSEAMTELATVTASVSMSTSAMTT